MKSYVSPLEQFLRTVDRKYPQLSASQCAEIAKFEPIFYLRDHSFSDTAPAQYTYSPDQPAK
jgi:hypothetical protein